MLSCVNGTALGTAPNPPRIPIAAIIREARKKVDAGERMAAVQFLFKHINEIFRTSDVSKPQSLLEIDREINQCLIEAETILKGLNTANASDLLIKAHGMRLAIVVDLVKQAKKNYEIKAVATKFLYEAEAIAKTEPAHSDFVLLLEEIKVLVISRQSIPPISGKTTQIMAASPKINTDPRLVLFTSNPPPPPRPVDPDDLWETPIPKQRSLPNDLTGSKQ
jgi:hypothetical protein